MRSTIRRSAWRVRLILALLLWAASAEVASRAFWYARSGISFRDPGSILRAFYPELEDFDDEQPAHGDKFYDILFLGGSTLHRDWGPMEQMLLEQLATHGRHNVRVFNLAEPAQTSRDSWLKYAALKKERFELVVLYDGFNEARANNAPPDIFKEDFSHYYWYQVVNTLAPYHGAASFAAPYTAAYLSVYAQHLLRRDRYLPIARPREDWIRYGQEPRSAVPFERNLRSILDLAAQRGDRVMLMTFAAYVPDGYSPDAFGAKRLDYRLHLYPVEFWGAPEHVLHTVAVHNEVVRKLAVERKEVLLVDQAKLMAGFPHYFNDVCHYTIEGSAAFVDHLLAVLLPTLKGS